MLQQTSFRTNSRCNIIIIKLFNETTYLKSVISTIEFSPSVIHLILILLRHPLSDTHYNQVIQNLILGLYHIRMILYLNQIEDFSVLIPVIYLLSKQCTTQERIEQASLLFTFAKHYGLIHPSNVN